MAELQIDPTLVRHYGQEAGLHAHAHAQVLFGLQGGLEMEVEGRAALVDASCGLVVPAGALHAYRATSTAKVLVLDCEPGPSLQRLRRFALPPGWQASAGSRHALLGLLGAAPALQPRRRLDLEALAALVDAQLAAPWTLERLAAACHLSPQRLRARFAQALGMPPMAFVRQRRLARAAQLLRQGWSLDAVALHVGYGGASALSVALKRDQGTGARALRQARRALLET